MEDQEKIRSYTDLTVWKEGHALVLAIYNNTATFPKEEVYGLTSQMRRSAVSITSNIAEGFGRVTYRDKLQFYVIARGSLIELSNQLLISRDVGFLSTDVFNTLCMQLNTTHKLLNAFIVKTRSLISP